MKTQEMKGAGGSLHGVTHGLLCPADALCDGAQALTPAMFGELLGSLSDVLGALGRAG